MIWFCDLCSNQMFRLWIQWNPFREATLRGQPHLERQLVNVNWNLSVLRGHPFWKATFLFKMGGPTRGVPLKKFLLDPFWMSIWYTQWPLVCEDKCWCSVLWCGHTNYSYKNFTRKLSKIVPNSAKKSYYVT